MNKYTENLYTKLPKKEILSLYKKGYSLNKIGKQYGVCSVTILKAFKYFGIKRRKATDHLVGNTNNLQHKISKETLEIKYLQNRKSVSEVGEELGISRGVIYYWLKRYKIPRHSFGELNIGKDRLLPESRMTVANAVRGKNNWNWKGGKTIELYRKYQSAEWKKISFSCKKRDKFICQKCGAKLPASKLRAHHVVSVRKGGTDTLSNLITFCNPCHIHIENSYRNIAQLATANLRIVAPQKGVTSHLVFS